MYERKVDLRSVFKLQPARLVTFFGVGAINKANDIARELRKEGIASIVVITGKTAHKTTGAWKKVKSALEKENISYKLYDKVRANPTYEGCEEAARIGEEAGTKAFLALGGGSAIDTAKNRCSSHKEPGKAGIRFL